MGRLMRRSQASPMAARTSRLVKRFAALEEIIDDASIEP